MDIKKFLTGTIVGAVLCFLLGWLIYGVILRHYLYWHGGTGGHIERTEPLMIYLVVGNLLYGAFIAYVFVKANIRTLADGFITGGVIGLLVTGTFDFMMYATTHITSKHYILADTVAAAVMVAVVGAVLALVIGGKKE